MTRPRVVTHNVASLDGRLTLAPGVLLLHGEERWEAIAGRDDDPYLEVIAAHHPQAILEGRGSFAGDDDFPPPLPPATAGADSLYRDFLLAPAEPPRRWFTVVDGGGRVRWMYKEFPGEEWRGWHLLVLVARATPPEYLNYLQREEIPYLVVGDERVDLPAALDRMATRLDVTCVVSTAGGRLNGALLRARLVDEVDVDYLPAVIGGRGTPALFDAPPLGAGEAATRLRMHSVEVSGTGRIRARYAVEPHPDHIS